MPIKPNDQQQLDALYSANLSAYGGRREDYFAALYLTRKFKVGIDEIAHQIAFGGNDYGIDAYYIDRDTRNLYLYQFKWTEEHNQFKGSMERLAKDGLARIFNGANQDPNQNDVVSHLKRSLREQKELVDRVYIHFVFKGDVNAAEKSDGLTNRREDIENKSHLVTGYFGDRNVELAVEFISDRPGLSTVPPTQSYVLHIRDPGAITHEGKTMHVGFVPLMDLYGIFKGLGQRFFDRNIRGSLSPDNPPNKKVRESLEKIVIKAEEEPSIFAFRHNGVTLAAERVALGHGEATLHAPRLLNGAQTVSSLARFFELKADNPILKSNRDRLDAIMVLAKIIEDDPSSEFIARITISNNQQNPVHPWALRAMDQRQVDLADKFRDDLGIFYSRQEGSFENLSDEERELLGIQESKDLRIRPLAQTFLAMQGDIYNMSHLPDVFESPKTYNDTFRTRYLTSDSRSIILAYKVGLMLTPVIRRLEDLLPQKYQDAVPKTRNLAWALLLQALFNDKRLATFQEDYGTRLTKNVAFNDILKQLTGSKIAPLLKDLMASPIYSDKVSQGKYDFLRTSEAFKNAMNIAYDKFKWSRKSF
jgi:hypothetical protein